MNLLQMSISAGGLVVAIIVLRAFALNKLPKTAFLVLWGVVLFRLFVPVGIPVQIDPLGAIRVVIADMISTNSHETAMETTPEVVVRVGEIFMFPLENELATHTYNIEAPTQSTNIVLHIWAVGAIGLVVFFASIYFKQYRVLRFATLIRDNEFLDKWLDKHFLLRPLSIMQSDRIKSPLAVGIFKPRIILPSEMNLCDEKLLNHVLLHEYFHIKRFDVLWKLVMVLAVCVHWFNPLVWVMFVLASRDMELTCDEKVLHYFGADNRTAYAYSILSMAGQRSKFAPIYIGFSKNAAEERIVSIMKTKRKSLMTVLISVLLVTVLSLGTFAVFATLNGDEYVASTPEAEPLPEEVASESLVAEVSHDTVGIHYSSSDSDEYPGPMPPSETESTWVPVCQIYKDERIAAHERNVANGIIDEDDARFVEWLLFLRERGYTLMTDTSYPVPYGRTAVYRPGSVDPAESQNSLTAQAIEVVCSERNIRIELTHLFTHEPQLPPSYFSLEDAIKKVADAIEDSFGVCINGMTGTILYTERMFDNSWTGHILCEASTHHSVANELFHFVINAETGEFLSLYMSTEETPFLG